MKKRGKRKRKTGKIIITDIIEDLLDTVLAIEEVLLDPDERKRNGNVPGLDQGLRMTKEMLKVMTS